MAFIVLPGADASGNGNDWTSNNINSTDTSSTTYDIMTDVPTLTDEDTANYATLNPLNAFVNPPYGALDANLTYTSQNAVWRASGATIYPTTGKWYYEGFFGTLGGGNYIGIGLKIPGPVGLEYVGQTANSWGILGNNTFLSTYTGNVATNNVSVTITTSTAVQVAVDFDAGKMWFGYNNNWLASGNPSTGANPTYTFTPNTQLQPILCAHACTAYINFGQRPFAYTPPTGYLKLNTFNLPDSSIVDGSEYFNPVLYTGNGTSQSITGVNFQPDFVWIKERSSTSDHSLHDVVRGSTQIVKSSTTAAEIIRPDSVTSFDTDGFSLGLNPGVNQSGVTNVAWNWKAGGTAVSNTDGTITSQVSANPTAGFSVVTYTGNGTSGATIGHGLGVVPDLVIFKNRTAAQNWLVQGDVIGSPASGYFLLLESTAAVAANGTVNTTMGSSTITLDTSATYNGNTNEHVAYCFASVEGYSKFGSYTGNGSTDGTFVYTGFRPAFVIVKKTTAAESWIMIDSTRSPDNGGYAWLYPNLSNAEAAGSPSLVDILSNGFKWRNSASGGNTSGTYIYMAFAENPFKNSLAR